MLCEILPSHPPFMNGGGGRGLIVVNPPVINTCCPFLHALDHLFPGAIAVSYPGFLSDVRTLYIFNKSQNFCYHLKLNYNRFS